MKRRYFVVFLLLGLFSACTPATLETYSAMKTFENAVCGMVSGRVKPGESIGVVAFYDGASGDYTALGDQWRGRVSAILAENGFRVKEVRDLDLIIDVKERADRDFSESDFWRKSGSDCLIVGSYYITRGKGAKAADYIEINLKLLRVKNQRQAGACCWSTRLQPGWQARSARIRGNKYQKDIEIIGPDTDRESGPPLTAVLDRKNPCYPAGAEVTMKIKSAAGVYLYILNVAADNSVTINYPNAYLTSKPLVSGEFVFPPPELPNLRKAMGSDSIAFVKSKVLVQSLAANVASPSVTEARAEGLAPHRDREKHWELKNLQIMTGNCYGTSNPFCASRSSAACDPARQ